MNSEWWLYGVVSGVVSMCGSIGGNMLIGILFIICFGLAGWIYDVCQEKAE